jgi:hypothetical protein
MPNKKAREVSTSGFFRRLNRVSERQLRGGYHSLDNISLEKELKLQEQWVHLARRKTVKDT